MSTEKSPSVPNKPNPQNSPRSGLSNTEKSPSALGNGSIDFEKHPKLLNKLNHKATTQFKDKREIAVNNTGHGKTAQSGHEPLNNGNPPLVANKVNPIITSQFTKRGNNGERQH